VGEGPPTEAAAALTSLWGIDATVEEANSHRSCLVGPVTASGLSEQQRDDIEAWSRVGAADSFNLMPDVLPSGLGTFVDTVVPILQRRGLFRKDYRGSTLRDHFGLAKPPSRFAKSVPSAASA
jgi:alkanesulfonate monooxygenase SsuD/methylene tetrahydromethanopterin reductase-like flavin-dependent oxidoreductase (luciferase family)